MRSDVSMYISFIVDVADDDDADDEDVFGKIFNLIITTATILGNDFFLKRKEMKSSIFFKST